MTTRLRQRWLLAVLVAGQFMANVDIAIVKGAHDNEGHIETGAPHFVHQFEAGVRLQKVIRHAQMYAFARQRLIPGHQFRGRRTGGAMAKRERQVGLKPCLHLRAEFGFGGRVATEHPMIFRYCTKEASARVIPP